MARKLTYGEQEGPSIEEQLQSLQKLIDRLKVMYEQYFMGIQKIAPTQLHRKVERLVRDLTQIKIRNTALRFRFATVTQKFGSYNTYWRRIMREIEQGRYIRDVNRVARKAERLGQDLPEEILASMPKRMRDRIVRDRELAKARGKAAGLVDEGDTIDEAVDDDVAVIRSGPVKVRDPEPPGNVHKLEEGLLGDDFDFDAMFADITEKKPKPAPKPASKLAPKPAPRPVSKPAPRPAPRPASKPAPRPIARAASSRPRPVASRAGGSAPPGMSEAQSRDLYKKYVQARKLVGERTDNLSYEKLMRTLNKQAPRIMKQHKAAGVEFSVVLKADKVVLKAKPKK